MASFAVVPKDASVDTETQSDAPCVTPKPQQTNQKGRVAVGFVATAALMATGAAVAITKSTSAAQVSDVDGAQIVGLQSCAKPDTGCSDWATAKIGNLLTFATEAECTSQCAANSACKFSNYQTEDCGTGANSAHKGACYLFTSCTEVKNDCWDLTPAGCTPSPAPPTTTEKDMGCSNWATAQIGNLLTFATEAECTAQCAANSACVYSNYQTEDCGTGEESAHKGACYLFTSCTKEVNKCWDLTGPGTATTTTTTAR